MHDSTAPEDVQPDISGPSNASTVVPRIYRPTPYKRRKHQKSRTGCKTCKARKIKCDEQRPACCNCILHGVKCPFLMDGQEGRVSTLPDLKPRDSLGYLELELLHHFTTQTSTTLATDTSVREFWRVNVVQMGLQCDYIMDTLLALSTLHIAHLNPEKREAYAARGMEYHQRASNLAIESMKNIGEGNDYTNLYVFSVLTVFFALGSPRSLDGFHFAADAVFPEWTFLLGGNKAFAEAITHWQEDDAPLRPFVAYGAKRWHAIYANKLTERLTVFDDLRQRVELSVYDEDLLRIYNFAIEELELSLRTTLNDPSAPRDVIEPLLWLYKVADDLVPLLKVPNQEAVAIFAHFCILLKHHESRWWLQGWGLHIISQAYGVLDEEHRAWITMPMKEMGWSAP